jgi:hypothetical protein
MKDSQNVNPQLVTHFLTMLIFMDYDSKIFL